MLQTPPTLYNTQCEDYWIVNKVNVVTNNTSQINCQESILTSLSRQIMTKFFLQISHNNTIINFYTTLNYMQWGNSTRNTCESDDPVPHPNLHEKNCCIDGTLQKLTMLLIVIIMLLGIPYCTCSLIHHYLLTSYLQFRYSITGPGQLLLHLHMYVGNV